MRKRCIAVGSGSGLSGAPIAQAGAARSRANADGALFVANRLPARLAPQIHGSYIRAEGRLIAGSGGGAVQSES